MTCFPKHKRLTPAVAVPVHTGLYHHGENPTAPGYSIRELFRLTR
jgi:hypothetical protein